MEKIDDLYKINRERFLDNYRITENILKSTEKNKTKIIAQWLVDNQSVGPSQESNVEIINYYSKYLKTFEGQTKPFESIKELLEHHLQIYFLYPLRINKLNATKLNRDEKSLTLLAQDLIKQYNLDHFYIKYLFPDNNYDSNDIKRILDLIDKRIFQPLYLD